VQDIIRGAAHYPGSIDILDSNQPIGTLRAGFQETAERGDQGTKM
jgi:hypothetical protein